MDEQRARWQGPVAVGIAVGLVGAVAVGMLAIGPPSPPTGDVVFAAPEPAADTADAAPALTPAPEAVSETAEPTPVADARPEPPASPQPDPAPADEATDHGAALWGRTFAIVAVSEHGQPKALVAERQGRAWTTTFHQRTDIDPPQRGVGWRWGCNSMGASADVTADRLRLDGSQSTGMMCEDAYMEQDRWASEFFSADPFWRLEGERLWLWTDDVLVELREDHEPPPTQCDPACEAEGE